MTKEELEFEIERLKKYLSKVNEKLALQKSLKYKLEEGIEYLLDKYNKYPTKPDYLKKSRKKQKGR